MTSERRRLERLKKSVEELRVNVRKLLKQSQQRCQRRSRKYRRSTPLLPSPPPSSPLSGLSPEGGEEDDDFDDEPKIFSNPEEEFSELNEIVWDEHEKLIEIENEELEWITKEFHNDYYGGESSFLNLNLLWKPFKEDQPPGAIRHKQRIYTMLI